MRENIWILMTLVSQNYIEEVVYLPQMLVLLLIQNKNLYKSFKAVSLFYTSAGT